MPDARVLLSLPFLGKLLQLPDGVHIKRIIEKTPETLWGGDPMGDEVPDCAVMELTGDLPLEGDLNVRTIDHPARTEYQFSEVGWHCGGERVPSPCAHEADLSGKQE